MAALEPIINLLVFLTALSVAAERAAGRYPGSPMLDADVYHAGHHGSHNATTWEPLNAMVRPEVAVISVGSCTRDVGQFNTYRFGHPRASTVDMLRAAISRRRSRTKQVPVAEGVAHFRQITMRDAI